MSSTFVEKLTAHSWREGNTHFLIDTRRVVILDDGQIRDVAKVEFGEDTLDLTVESGRLHAKVKFSDDGKTMWHRCRLTLNASFGNEQYQIENTYIATEEAVPFPTPRNIYHAIELGDLDFIKNYTGDFDVADDHGSTVLVHACGAPFFDVMQYVLDNTHNIDQTNLRGATALSVATAYGQVEFVRALIEAGATTDDRFNSLIHTAVSDGNTELLNLLLEYGADTSGINNERNTLLEEATAQMKGLSFLYQENLPAVKLLVEKGDVSVNTVNPRNGNTALLVAAAYGAANVVAYLLESGADIQHVNNNGENALLYAIHWSKGTTIDDVTLLDYGHVFDTLKLLVEKGIALELTNADGKNACQLAEEEGSKRLLSFLSRTKNNVELIQ